MDVLVLEFPEIPAEFPRYIEIHKGGNIELSTTFIKFLTIYVFKFSTKSIMVLKHYANHNAPLY